MKVINVAGFDIKFNKDDKIYFVPNDGKLHIIPDKCFFEDNFQGLLRVIIPPTPVKHVVKKMNTSTKSVDVNDPTIKEVVIEKVEEKKKKPLAGKKLKPSIRKKLRKTRKTGKKKTKKNSNKKIENNKME